MVKNLIILKQFGSLYFKIKIFILPLNAEAITFQYTAFLQPVYFKKGKKEG